MNGILQFEVRAARRSKAAFITGEFCYLKNILLNRQISSY